MLQKNILSRVFILDSFGNSRLYGIGSYIKALEGLVTLCEQVEFIFVTYKNNDTGLHIKSDNKFSFFNIPIELLGAMDQIAGETILCYIDEFYNIESSDIFHLNNFYLFNFAVALKKNTNARVVYTVHLLQWRLLYENNLDEFMIDWNNRYNNIKLKSMLIESELCGLSDAVICLNLETRNFLIKGYLLDETKISIIPNGVGIPNKSDEKLTYKEDLGFPDKSEIILYIGRLDKQKGVPELISAFESLYEKRRNIYLVLIGEGDLEISYKQLSFKYGEKIHFTGYLTRDHIEKYLAVSDVFVFPSFSEESPYAVLEAMANNVPCIVSDIPAFEILQNEHDVLKVTHIESHHISSSIMRILNSEILRKKLIKNSYLKILNQFSMMRMLSATLSVYKRII